MAKLETLDPKYCPKPAPKKRKREAASGRSGVTKSKKTVQRKRPMESVRKGKMLRKDHDKSIRTNAAEADAELYSGPGPEDPTENTVFQIGKAWGKVPAEFIPHKYFPCYVRAGKVLKYDRKSETWPHEILRPIETVAKAIKELEGGEKAKNKFRKMVLDAIDARRAKGDVDGTAESGMTAEDVRSTAQDLSEEMGFEISS